MKKAKIKSRWAALTVVLALLGLTVRMNVAYGAIGIETDKKGSMEFEVSAKTYTGPEGSEVDYETLNLGSLAAIHFLDGSWFRRRRDKCRDLGILC